MLHKMRLQDLPFDSIASGSKTIEIRLNDDKRKLVRIGDQIEFSKLPALKEKVNVKF